MVHGENIKLSEEIPNIIAAFTSETKGIGYKNDLPWKRALKLDLKWLNYLTTEHPNKKIALIMGRKTYESIGRPLPKRVNIVISKDSTINNVINLRNVNEALTYSKENKLIPVFFGGRRIFEEALKMECKVFFTIVKECGLCCDTFFPDFNISLVNITDDVNDILKCKYEMDWEIKNGEIYENDYSFSFFTGINKIS